MRATNLLRLLLITFALLFAGISPAAGAEEQLGHAVDSSLLHRLDPRTPGGLRRLFTPTTEGLPFVSAHRGGARPGFPENCLATFENTLRHTFAIIEVDPRYTKDGEIVLHHDPALDRTTTGHGRVADFTLAELKQLKLKDAAGSVTEHSIPTLDEALQWARGKTILVLDQKDVPTEARVTKIEEHQAEAWAMLIVYSFKDAQTCYALNTNIMMEVMIPTIEKAREFDATSVPWSNVIAFVGHTPPEDPALYQFIHQKGASCVIGTSRNLDRRVVTGGVSNIQQLEPDYRAFLRLGADLIETDIPIDVGELLYPSAKYRGEERPYFHSPSR